MQAEAGHMSLTGDPDGAPERYGLSVVDLMTGLAASFALLAGIHSARATGRGRDLDTSLFDLALFNLNYPGTWYLNAGAVQGREKRSAHPSLVPSQLYRTQDGWIFVMCNKEKFWALLAEELGHPEWAADPRYAKFPARLERRDEITVMLDEAFSHDTTAAWLAKLNGKVPVARVNDVAQALDNPFVAERGGVADFRYPDGRTARLLANPIRCADADLPRRAAPALGADTDALLCELGYSPERIGELRARRAIG
jgi:crotonobetainyl-CoA:carnitine CoA-transferase CaiB-like acyl-CoA transferase